MPDTPRPRGRFAELDERVISLMIEALSRRPRRGPMALLCGVQLGILIRGPDVLESTRRVDTVLLDERWGTPVGAGGQGWHRIGLPTGTVGLPPVVRAERTGG